MFCTHPIPAGNLYALSRLVSNAGFQRIMFEEDFLSHADQLKILLEKIGIAIPRRCSVKDLIEFAFDLLLTHYRHEYIYKSALLNSFILKKYSLADSILLNEFKIGKSKADAVLVNGTNKVFEIKTELDSPERLISQLADYRKIFSEVFIIVHSSKLDKYSKLINDQVGLMCFDGNLIEVVRPAKPNNAMLDIETMMKALRKDEFLQIVRSLSGSLPLVKPTSLFKCSLEVVKSYAPDEVQEEFLKVIKQRINPATNKLVTRKELPDSLRLPCYFSNITHNQYINLVDRLNFKI